MRDDANNPSGGQTAMRHSRVCPVCGHTFPVRKPSQRQRCCSHSCAFTEIGDRVREAASKPEAIAKRAAKRRRNNGGYVKVNGRHEHRVVVEKRIGRRLRSDEIVHHRDENKANNEDSNLEIVTRAEHARIHFSKD